MAKKQSIGRSLIKKSKTFGTSNRHNSIHASDNSCLPVHSITDENSLAEFFSIAKLANSDFAAQKKHFRIVPKDEVSGVAISTSNLLHAALQSDQADLIKLPRRPSWNREMSSQELHELENEEFLNWRRGLARLENTEGVVLTPFEKNIEFWRQLWRVVERSDVLVQIVDARQPLLYYCPDLEKYAHEVDSNKITIVLVNKADLLTPEQRFAWQQYFESKSVRAVFWSATEHFDPVCEHGPSKADAQVAPDSEIESVESDATDSDSTTKADTDGVDNSESTKTEELCSAIIDDTNRVSVGDHHMETTKDRNIPLLSPTELLDFLAEVYPAGRPTVQPSHVTIGFVGYPNVGKSSTLNALIGTKKTAVSATPGRTKHFQTLVVRPNLVLCDCPGLVFPSFAYSRADLVLAGILPIDRLRDFLSPIGLICQRIPRVVLEFLYGIDLSKPNSESVQSDEPTKPPTPYELLAAHALSRSFMTAKGNPHYDRSARLILKDYVQGRLLFCHPPPNMDPWEFQTLGHDKGDVPPSLSRAGLSKIPRRRPTHASHQQDTVTQFDRSIFESEKSVPRPHLRSRKALLYRPVPLSGDLDDNDGASVDSTSSWTTVDTSVGGSSLLSGVDSSVPSMFGDQKKPWRVLSLSKRGDLDDTNGLPRSRKRREKLRRVYKHLDQHQTT